MKDHRNNNQGFWVGYVDSLAVLLTLFLILYIAIKHEKDVITDKIIVIKDSIETVNFKCVSLEKDTLKLKTEICENEKKIDSLRTKLGGKPTCRKKNQESIINGYVDIDYLFEAVIVENNKFLVRDFLYDKSDKYEIMNLEEIKNKYSEQISVSLREKCYICAKYRIVEKVNVNINFEAKKNLGIFFNLTELKPIKRLNVYITEKNKIQVKIDNEVTFIGEADEYIENTKNNIINNAAEINCISPSIDDDSKKAIYVKLLKCFIYIYTGNGME